MNDEQHLRILLRIATELSYRTLKVRRILKEIGPIDGGEYQQLANTIENALDEIECLLPDTLEGVYSDFKAGGGRAKNAISVVHKYLKTYSEWFTNIHELLVYLPRQSVRTETIASLVASFGNHYTKRKPSVTLGSLFNAFEFDFFQLVKERLPDISEIGLDQEPSIVLQLAISDRSSPPAWAILAHEMGHAIDHEEDVSKQVMEEFVSDPDDEAVQFLYKWCKELCADLIAAEVLGPAPILALISMEYCLHPIGSVFGSSDTHPATQWRMLIVSEYLAEKYNGLDCLQEEIDFYKSSIRYNLASNYSEEADQANQITNESKYYENILKPISISIIKKVSELNLQSSSLDKESLERCSLRLNMQLPISAQGDAREVLQEKIGIYKSEKYVSEEERISAFNNLVSLFSEEPLSIAAILTSCYKKRLSIINGCISNPELMSDSSVLKNACVSLDRLDDLVARSIDASVVHSQLHKKMRSKGQM